ncbi:TCEA3 protein, partial [Hemiprocne comata]|nr:TCEA3 protein [Hemiprocne comata]
EGALDLLKSLTGYTMTIQLLQTTRIGVAVNSVRKHCSDEEVVASAKILIKNWKRLLGEQSSDLPWAEKDMDGEKEKKKGLDFPSCLNEGLLPAPGEAPATARRKGRRAPSHGTPDRSLGAVPGPQLLPVLSCRANSSKAKPETPRTPTSPPFTPSPCFSFKPAHVSCQPWSVSMQGWSHSCSPPSSSLGVSWQPHETRTNPTVVPPPGTDMKYRNRVRSRISNLKDPKNPSLRRNVLCGAIPPSLIARMTAEEMASDELKELRNAMTQEAIREHQMAKTGGTVTDLFQCGKCKKKNCTYNQVQTRSADEPMTTFVLCNECGNRWKVC